MTTRKKKGERTLFRSSKSGRIVTEGYAKGHPSTTQRERRPAPRRTSPPCNRRGR
jgi:hypothetical protein